MLLIAVMSDRLLQRGAGRGREGKKNQGADRERQTAAGTRQGETDRRAGRGQKVASMAKGIQGEAEK